MQFDVGALTGCDAPSRLWAELHGCCCRDIPIGATFDIGGHDGPEAANWAVLEVAKAAELGLWYAAHGVLASGQFRVLSCEPGPKMEEPT